MNEQKIASSQRPGGSKGLHLPARTVSSCFPNRYKSLLRWDPDKIALQDLFCAGYMLCEMVVREEETQVFTWRTNPCAVTKFVFHSLNAQIAGIVSITDASGFGFKHLRAIGLEDGKNMVKFCCLLFCKIVSKLKYLWGGDMKLLFENLFIEGELFQCQLPTLHEANPRSSCSKVFLRQKKTYKPTPISRLSPNFSGFSTWCSICWSHSCRPRFEMGSSSTQEIFPLSGQDCWNCYHALKLKCPPLRRGGLSDDDAFYNRDYVPIDILPSDVGGGNNAPSMASLIFSACVNGILF